MEFLDSVKAMPLMKLPVRSCLVKVGSQTLLFSPGSALTESDLRSCGEVTDVIAPNLFHCAGVPQAHRIFPRAQLWAPPRGKEVKKEIPWSHELSKTTWPYQDQVPMIHLRGIPKIEEVVFIDRKSRSLIVADLCFNLVDSRGLGAWIILSLFGTYKRFAVSKFFLKFLEDKKAFQSSLEELFSYEFDQVVVNHGQIVRDSGKERLRKALHERGLI